MAWTRPSVRGLRRPAGTVLAEAEAEATAQARWLCRDLHARRGVSASRELLLGEAAELAGSALARDQLLALALERMVSIGPEANGPLLGPEPGQAERDSIRHAVAALGAPRGCELHPATAELHRRAHPMSGTTPLTARRRDDAILQERLWDDPRLPCPATLRCEMRESGRALRLQAEGTGPASLPAKGPPFGSRANAIPRASGLRLSLWSAAAGLTAACALLAADALDRLPYRDTWRRPAALGRGPASPPFPDSPGTRPPGAESTAAVDRARS